MKNRSDGHFEKKYGSGVPLVGLTHQASDRGMCLTRSTDGSAKAEYCKTSPINWTPAFFTWVGLCPYGTCKKLKNICYNDINLIGQRNLSQKGANMINTNRKRDHAIFRRTASKTKLINVAPKVMRGGIRL